MSKSWVTTKQLTVPVDDVKAADEVECIYCGAGMQLRYDRFYGGIPRFRMQCDVCGACGPVQNDEEAAKSAVEQVNAMKAIINDLERKELVLPPADQVRPSKAEVTP